MKITGYIGKRLYHEKYGYYNIISDDLDYHNTKNKKVIIEFENTGYKTSVYLQKALEGSVKDVYYRNKCGVGYLGEFEKVPNFDKSQQHRIQPIWGAMISRCYNPNDKDYDTYGGAGITVSEDWKCYANFLRDFMQMDNYEEWKQNDITYTLDKDLLQQGKPKNERVYSKETCVLIPKSRNSSLIGANPNCSCPFIGVNTVVYQNTISHEVDMYIPNGDHIYGSFSNPYYAAVYRDWYARQFNPNIQFNNVPCDDKALFEALKYKKTKNGPVKQMYHLVDKGEK